MQNKGAIRLFAIALALVSLYQLSFTFVTNGVKQEAEEYAHGDLMKEAAYLDSMAGQEVYNFLWIKKFTLKECQQRELNLGLDLKGGMNVTLEVSAVDLVRSLAGSNSKDSTFVKALNLAKERRSNSQSDFVTLFSEAYQEVNPTGRLAAVFTTREMSDRINLQSTNEEVVTVIREEVQDAIDNSFNILGSRIDQFGVAQPNIQRIEGGNRILVELPGVKDVDRVRDLLQRSAKLEFWETYTNNEVFPYLQQANERLREIQAAKESVKKDTTTLAQADTTQTDELAEASESQADTSQAEPDSLLAEESDEDTSSLLSKIENQEGDTTGASQSADFEQFAKENPLFAVLRPNTTQDGQLIQTAAIGYAALKDTSKVNQYLNMPQIRDILPRNLRLNWGVKPIDEEGIYFQLIALKTSNREGDPALAGDVITNAREEFGQNQASAVVNMTMNAEGAQQWARLTKDNVGKQIAIVLDNYVYSFPTVQGEITGGRSEISGDFTITEAKDLANILKSGRMPAPARIVEAEFVGPSLGQEAISSGLMSFLIAFVVVMLYMVFYYKGAGLVANIALISNVFFIFGVLASLGAALTLPGIAGIVLTIGMSVDANVLIYDRIREELAAGKGLKLALKDGYNNAYSAIVDANVTTLLTGIILFVVGHGPVKGFATTLVIGILTSLFSAIFITRLVFTAFLDRNKPISFATKFTENAFANTNIDFLGRRKIAYIISGVIILIGLVSLFTRGLNQGVDFKGGRTYVVRFDHDINTQDVARSLAESYGEAPEVKIFGERNQVKITTKYMIDSEAPEADKIVETKLYEGLQPIIGDDVSREVFLEEYRMSSQKVGPTIADDIKRKAVLAILLSLIAMFLYMFIRFRGWQFGLGAFAALTHDVLVVLGIFSLFYSVMPFSMEIDQAFIAAILTVIGYSLNDTVVVFDRIRELLGLHKKQKIFVTYNNALNSTLSRTFSTSMSTFFVLLTIFIFGGEVIRGFTFALLVGVVVGTYSSLFIATPVVFDTVKQIEQTTVTVKEKRKARRKKKQPQQPK